MKAIVFDRTGEPSEVLTAADIAMPTPGAAEALIEVAARPIHPADLAFIRGQYRIRPQLPQTAGLEGVGRVVQAAPDSNIEVGARVAFRWLGAWAEFAAVPTSRLIEVPEDVGDATACQISLNPLTALALLEEAEVSSDDWIILTAAASTVSNIVGAIARSRGLHIIGLVRGDAAAANCSADIVHSIDDPEFTGKILATLGQARAAALLDSVGGPILPQLFSMLAPGARVVAYGVQDREPAAVTNGMLIYSNLIWKGFGIDRWLSRQNAPRLAALYQELWSMIRTGELKLPVHATFGLVAFDKALAANADKMRRGKVLLV